MRKATTRKATTRKATTRKATTRKATTRKATTRKASKVRDEPDSAFMEIVREVARQIDGNLKPSNKRAPAGLRVRRIAVKRSAHVTLSQVGKVAHRVAKQQVTVVVSDWLDRKAKEVAVLDSADRFDALHLLDVEAAERERLRRILVALDAEVGLRIVRLIRVFIEFALTRVPEDPERVARSLREATGAIESDSQEARLAREIAKKRFSLLWPF